MKKILILLVLFFMVSCDATEALINDSGVIVRIKQTSKEFIYYDLETEWSTIRIMSSEHYNLGDTLYITNTKR